MLHLLCSQRMTSWQWQRSSEVEAVGTNVGSLSRAVMTIVLVTSKCFHTFCILFLSHVNWSQYIDKEHRMKSSWRFILWVKIDFKVGTQWKCWCLCCIGTRMKICPPPGTYCHNHGHWQHDWAWFVLVLPHSQVPMLCLTVPLDFHCRC